MKNMILITTLGLVLVLTGCSGGGSTKETDTPDITSEEISSVDPGLTQSGYYRDALTDPALFDYLNKQSSGLSNPGTVVASQGSEKVGKTSTFQKNRKYNVSGIAQIISENKIQISSFNYNGSCGPIYFGLSISSSSDKTLAKLKEISSAQSNSSFDMTIPSNISLIQFESINIYCYTEEDPISSAII